MGWWGSVSFSGPPIQSRPDQTHNAMTWLLCWWRMAATESHLGHIILSRMNLNGLWPLRFIFKVEEEEKEWCWIIWKDYQGLPKTDRDTNLTEKESEDINVIIIEVKDIFNGSSFEMNLFIWPLISYQPNRTKDHFPPPPSSWDNRILVKSLNSWSHKELFASLVFSVAG